MTISDRDAPLLAAFQLGRAAPAKRVSAHTDTLRRRPPYGLPEETTQWVIRLSEEIPHVWSILEQYGSRHCGSGRARDEEQTESDRPLDGALPQAVLPDSRAAAAYRLGAAGTLALSSIALLAAARALPSHGGYEEKLIIENKRRKILVVPKEDGWKALKNELLSAATEFEGEAFEELLQLTTDVDAGQTAAEILAALRTGRAGGPEHQGRLEAAFHQIATCITPDAELYPLPAHAEAGRPGLLPEAHALEQQIITLPAQRPFSYRRDCELRREFARLIEAVWPERAEFITLQLDRAQKGRPQPAPREIELLKSYEHEWSGGLVGAADFVHFERGFIVGVNVGVRMFLARADQVFAVAPVYRLSVSDLSERNAASFFASPHLERIRALSFPFYVGWGALDELANSPHLKSLVHLSFSTLDETGFWKLAHARNLPALKHVDFGSSRLDLSEDEGGTEYETWYDQGVPVGGHEVATPAGLGFEARSRIGHIPWLHEHHWPVDPDALLALLEP